MREIKFRAWDGKNKKMEGEWTVWGIPQLVQTSAEEGWNTRELKLLQYTGLKDKNGKEIYEGDVVKFEIENSNIKGYKHKGYLVWDKFRSGWGVKDLQDSQDHIYKFGNWGIYEGTLEIIGNIYENPDLL